MPSRPIRPLQYLRRQARSRGRIVAAFGGLTLLLAMMAPAFPRPPFGDQQARGQRQIEDAQRSEIRRSLDSSRNDYRQEGYRERRRMSDEERQSLRQAVRDAYGDPRGRPRN